MLAEERKQIICQIITEKGAIRISELAKQLNITETTLRRDLDELQAEKKVRRTHGGAMSAYPSSIEYSIKDWETKNLTEKRLIAAKAYEFIDSNDAVIIDSSSTARELVQLILNGDKDNITIVTTSFNVIFDAGNKKNITIIHTGGVLKSNLNAAYGPIAENMINNIRADKAFIGINGIDIEYGFSTPRFDEAALKRAMVASSKQSFVLADHTKLRLSYLAKTFPINGVIDYVIMDDVPGDSYQDDLSNYINLILVR